MLRRGGRRLGVDPYVLTFEAGIIAFAVGIATYFAWPTEPNPLIGLALTITVLLLLWRMPSLWSGVFMTIAIMLAGFSWSALHTRIVSPNPVNIEQRLEIKGWVSAIDQGGSMRRLQINVTSSDPLPRTGLPKHVRIRVGRNFPDFQISDGIIFDTVIGPMPGPAIPNGYDPGRRAFFDGLAGTGFAISDGQKIDVDLSLRAALSARIESARREIAKRVMRAAPDKTAGLQAALLTGIRDYIPERQTESLRASGLAHILAISGLHMGMVAFGVYVVASVLLAAIYRLARARDVRKIAAVIGIFAATAYLGLSGASVATQRAFIMVCIAFLAVLLDRRVISLRSVAVAALLTLLIRPEALLSVGFQMSFAAVSAMVVIFRAWQDRWPRQKSQGFRDRVRAFYGSLFGTSLVAGFATGVFALLHFGRLANYGLIANMAAMTVFPAVMAFGIIALLLMPVGLESAPLLAMSWLIEFMLSVAEWVSGLPGAVATVKASQPWVIGLYGLGFALVCLSRRKAVLAGLSGMVVATLFWTISPIYDLRITDQGRVSLISKDQAVTTSLRADRYGRDQFSRASGTPRVEWTNYRDNFAHCDVLACRFIVNAVTVSVIEEPSEVPLACLDSDIVVLASRSAGPVARRACQATLLDHRALIASGGYHVKTSDPMKMVPILSENRRRRLWGQ
ncbi:competence protein ComEC [Algimonas arctica]|uniref:Competence protein ComEC n=1 Tax=Algimonas arctica TaxID=1479486 RepID=A0A8J3G214_9PROT|nr:ComEC/Rec2 family competence protein [Algimonas arctica]GHA90692.1 competence protein ComEC [Algimonas arctica]